MRLLFFLLTLSLFASKGFSQTGKAQLPADFYKCWASSFEEDDDAVAVTKTYRPCDYKDFKPSMFRFRMEFFKDGKCKWLQLAANDAHYFVDGVWKYKGGLITVRDLKGEVKMKFKIKNLKYNRMNIVEKEFN